MQKLGAYAPGIVFSSAFYNKKTGSPTSPVKFYKASNSLARF
jgi:hypothetical protein